MTRRLTRRVASEFLDFADQLTIGQFKSLSQGIGLGDVRPVRARGAKLSAPLREEYTYEQRLAAEPANQNLRRRVPLRPSLYLFRGLVTSAVDLLVFSSAVSVAGATAALILSLYNPEALQGLQKSLLYSWFMGLSIVKMVLAFVFFYCLYGIIFRVLLGRSLGTSLVQLWARHG